MTRKTSGWRTLPVFFQQKAYRKSFTYIRHYKEFRGILMFADMCDLLMVFTCYAGRLPEHEHWLHATSLAQFISHPQQNKKCP